MGGYGAHCMVEPSTSEDCFEAYVWHDGEFPFSDESGGSPVRLHHCLAEQFVNFGNFVASVSVSR